jgi:hypothetical protein
MKLYLDDRRDPPSGWVKVMCAKNAIKFLERDKDSSITHISLDHDLGDEKKTGTGYDVLLWIEEQVAISDYNPPEISIHTANPAARQKMELALKKINQFKDIKNK